MGVLRFRRYFFSNMDHDLEKALALSLKELQGKAQATSLYPQMSNLTSQSAYQPASQSGYVSVPQSLAEKSVSKVTM